MADNIFDEYQDAFDECFPRMLCMGLSEEEMKAIAEGCVKAGVPYDVPADDDF